MLTSECPSRLIEEGRDCAPKGVWNRCGQAARVQSGANRSGAVALVPYTPGVTLGRRSEDVALGAGVGGARRQLLDEPVGKVQPPIGRFALRTAHVDASALKADVLPPNLPRFVDPGPGFCQEGDEICRRPPLASGGWIQPWLASHKECCLDDVVSFTGAVCLGHPLQEAAQALRIIRLLECETAERRCRGVNVLLSNAAGPWTSKLEHLVRTMFCAPGRNRTYDRQIRNRP